MDGPHNVARPSALGGPKARVATVPRVRGLVLDVPDVLYDATLWRRWLFQLVAHQGIRVGYEPFCRAWDVQLADVNRGRREYAEALQSFLLDRGLSWAQVDEIEAASRIQRHNLDVGLRPFPGVARVLEGLADRELGLVAWADIPFPAVRLRERLVRLAPRIDFDAVLTSFELECTLPEEACYRAMVEALGVSAGEIAYVGHESEHLASARAAGLVVVAVNFEPAAEADHHLAQFGELLSLADQWSNQAAPRTLD